MKPRTPEQEIGKLRGAEVELAKGRRVGTPIRWRRELFRYSIDRTVNPSPTAHPVRRAMRSYINQMYRDIYGPLPMPTKRKLAPPAPARPPSPSTNLKKMNNPTLGELPIYAQHLKTVKVPGAKIPKLKFKRYLSDLDQPYTKK